MARATEAGSRKSPVTYSSDRSAMARLVLDGRSSTRTSSPRDTNWRATWLPRKPEAPVTSVVMRFSRLLHPPLHVYLQGRRLAHRVLLWLAFATEAPLPSARKIDAKNCRGLIRALRRLCGQPHRPETQR